MQKEKIRNLTVLSLFSAFIVAMTFIPYVGYITTGLLSITTLHIVVIIGCITLNNYVSGLVLGTVWGITCLLYAIANGTADAAIFLDPRISVIPRMLVGVLTVFFYKIAAKASKNKLIENVVILIAVAIFSVIAGILCYNLTSSTVLSFIVEALLCAAFSLFLFSDKSKEHAPVLIAAIGGTFSNTVLVLTAISLFNKDGIISLSKTITNIFSTVIAINGTIEMIAAIIISVPCCVALAKFTRNRSDD